MPDYARRVNLSVTIDGHDVAGAFAPYLLDFSYADNAGGKADEARITLHNRDGKFTGEWKPKKGMEIEASIICADWEESGDELELPCGTFKIDEIEYSGPPDKVSIKAVSADLTGPLRDTKKTRAWENMSLEGVARQIAGENGLECHYSGPEHKFERQDQRSEGDIAFLNRLCGERSMHCKVHQGMIVLFDMDEAEGAQASLVIPKTGGMYSPKSWNFKVSSAGTDYRDAEVAYTDPKTGTTHKARVKSSRKTDTVGAGKTMTVQKRVEDPAQAVALGRSELHRANSKERTGSVEIMGCPKIAAGQMVGLEGFGDFSGSYFVRAATHKVGGSGGYSTSLELAAPAPTEEDMAHDEKNEAALAAKKEIVESEKARTANVEIFKAGELILPEEALARLAELIQMVEEAVFESQNGSGQEKATARTDSVILCLEDIAQAEADRSEWPDRQGWLYLRDMIRKWLSSRANSDANQCGSPLMIDWDWLYSFQRVKEAYSEFTVVAPNAKNTILNEAARKELGDIIFNNKTDPKKHERLAQILSKRIKRIDEKTIAFDFINSPWYEWEALYYTLITVPVFSFPIDGLTTALNGFTLRALASGRAERQGEIWQICVEKVAVFAHDKFNFAASGAWHNDILGFWNCENRTFDLYPTINNVLLNNEIFREFQKKYKAGGDFLVLSLPHQVEHFSGECYAYP